MKTSYTILYGFLFFSILSMQSQTSELDIKLAKNYYLDGDYQKAILYFEKIAKEPSNTSKIYDYYKSSLIELKQFKSAEKLCKSMIKQFPENLSLLVDLGKINGNQEKFTKQEQLFEKAINSINSQTNYNSVSNLGLAFEKIGDLERALKVYKSAGEKNEINPYAYHSKLAFIYNKLDDIHSMVNTYLDMLNQSERFISSVLP